MPTSAFARTLHRPASARSRIGVARTGRANKIRRKERPASEGTAMRFMCRYAVVQRVDEFRDHPPWGTWASPNLADVSLGGLKALGYNIFCAIASAATRRPRVSRFGRGSRARLQKVTTSGDQVAIEWRKISDRRGNGFEPGWAPWESLKQKEVYPRRCRPLSNPPHKVKAPPMSSGSPRCASM
jgi:hypothetical protein